jgi:phosphoribosyl-AMP cyclohydrolase / phosphoribosyl-ATP pyrophosphohydrolase
MPAPPLRFDEQGLLPCVMQDARSGEILTLAYMNEEALRRTLDTGEVHFFSRSRRELWHKGETSGNTMRLRQLRYDCDADALLALVDPAGPACHTGERSCFHRRAGVAQSAAREPSPEAFEALPGLERTLTARAAERPAGSYTAELLADPPRIGEKLREESSEAARAAASESPERLAEEAADVLYHLEVLMLSRGVPFAAALDVLNGRRR